MMRVCSDCPKAITARSTTGRCRDCAARRPKSAAFKAKVSASIKKRWQVELKDPAVRERMRQEGWRLHRHPKAFAPETNAKRVASIVEHALGWCPPSLRDENKRLRRAGYLLVERQRLISEHIAHEARRVIANTERGMHVREQRRKAQAY